MSRFRSELAIVLAAGTTLAGCGFTAPHDKLTVIFNGERATVAQSGTIKAEFGDVPELNYEGPIGCQGHYFDSGDGSDQTSPSATARATRCCCAATRSTASTARRG